MSTTYDYLMSLIKNPTPPAATPHKDLTDWLAGSKQSSEPQYRNISDWLAGPKQTSLTNSTITAARGGKQDSSTITAPTPAVNSQQARSGATNGEPLRQAYQDGQVKSQDSQKSAGIRLSDKIRDNWRKPESKDSEFGSIENLDDAEPNMLTAENTTDIAIDGKNGYTLRAEKSGDTYIDTSGSDPEDTTRALAKWLIGNPVNAYATQQGWFPDLFYAAGFIRDDNGIYHARQDCLQQYGGYNDFYDTVFDYATDMDKENFPFAYNGKDYILWAWKGDYLNLGAGAEMGIYTKLVIDGTETDHWLVDTSLAMPMRLTLKYAGDTIIRYNPTENQWWVTGWNPYCQGVQADNLTASYIVNFSDNIDIFTAFYDTWKNNNRWTFYPDRFTAKFTF